MIEINRMFVSIDKSYFKEHSDGVFLAEGNLPVINADFKLELLDVNWDLVNENQWPSLIYTGIAGEILNADWNVLSKMKVVLECPLKKGIVQWGKESPFKIFNIRLGTKSEFYINDNKVDLISTINRLLNAPIVEISTIQSQVKTEITRLSKIYFESDLLNHLLEDIYYLIRGDFEADTGIVELSAAYDTDHFSETKKGPPYLFLSIPTMDLVYFVNHFQWPKTEIKSYALILKSIEVTGDNRLNVNLKELTKDWDVEIEVKLNLQDNKIYPVVEDLQVAGLDFLTKALFKVFKGILINQIEKQPISIDHMYSNFKTSFSEKYPFLKLQPEYSPSLDVLKLTKDNTDVLLHWMLDKDIT